MNLHVHSPAAGSVREVLVSPGDSVAQGDSLILIDTAAGRAAVESPAAGIVASVAVIAGDAVAQQQLVATIEPLPA